MSVRAGSRRVQPSPSKARSRSRPQPRTLVVGCDVGGTFTDAVLWDGTRLAHAKRPTTPENRAAGTAAAIATVLREADAEPAHVSMVLHGSTVATNAMLTRAGPRVGLITNAGFEHALEIGRQDRRALYDSSVVRVPPLVERKHRFGVRGRIDAAGHEVERFDAAGLRRLAPRLRGLGAIAISFLHSYANDAHERAAESLVGRLLPGVPCATSAATARVFREYERTSTTVANAFLLPVMKGYLSLLRKELRARGVEAPLLVLDSAGGALSTRAAQRHPVSTVLSGPAGGAAALAFYARACREPNLLGLDMGGTSTDLGLAVDGVVREAHEGTIAGLPLHVPMVDVTTIGAGGGSIARIDDGGILRVGPESAEAVPGPAAYGRGGTHATVTDAHVILGHLESLLGGTWPLDRAAAAAAITPLAEDLSLSVPDVAEAILRVADAQIVNAARLVTTARGFDPRFFTLCAYGGAGPLHGASVAAALGVKRVLFPSAPGTFCAFGMLTAPARVDRTRTWLRPARAAVPELRRLAREVVSDLRTDGFARSTIALRFEADLRYRGQSHEITIPLRAPEAIQTVGPAFERAHEREFAFVHEGTAIEIVNLRAIGRARLPLPVPASALRRRISGSGGRRSRPSDTDRWPKRAIRWGGRTVRARVAEHGAVLEAGGIRGPAIVSSATATYLVPPGARCRRDAWDNLLLDLPRASSGPVPQDDGEGVAL
ncbi:MAG: hydantoinase/oxoprolinase family protein [Thermoplasmatota archaeon]